MSERLTIFFWAERGAIADARKALDVAGVLPSSHNWRTFLDRLLLWSGAVTLGAAVVFFIAYNWNDLGKFARFGLIEVALVASVLAYWRLGPDRAAGKASLLVASICLGALLALFGQTYQTGADTWELFATWAALMAPWVLMGRFAALWLVWVAILNVAISFYFRMFPQMAWMAFSTEPELWSLFAFNTTALVVWETVARQIKWLDERWAMRILMSASGITITLAMIQTIFAWQGASAFGLMVYPVWLVGMYAAYRWVVRDLLALAGCCLSVVIVVTAYLAHLLSHGGAGGMLVIALVVIAMAGGFGWWLKSIASELNA